MCTHIAATTAVNVCFQVQYSHTHSAHTHSTHTQYTHMCVVGGIVGGLIISHLAENCILSCGKAFILSWLAC